MNALLYSSIQSAAYGNQFECSTAGEKITDALFGSMTHQNEVGVWDDGEALLVVSLLNTEGLKAKFPKYAVEDGLLIRHPKNDLTDHLQLLGEVFAAAASLPPDPDAVLPERTDVQRTVKARLGQHKYKVEQLDIWDGACAVTGIKEPTLLRASHAKPWSDPTITDSERLDPANGLPLVIHLDALFDQGWITFADDGKMQISPLLDPAIVAMYDLNSGLKLRRPLSAKQKEYISYHRDHVFKKEV